MADFVTFRDLHEQLEKVHDRVGAVDDKLDDRALETERRFGRVEKLIAAGGVVQTVVWAAIARGGDHAPVKIAGHLFEAFASTPGPWPYLA